jgi:ferredoxin-NADP reductase
VVRVIDETADARTFELADVTGAPITFAAGQFLTLHVEVEGRRYRRAYSLSSSPDGGGTARITVKRVVDGRVSRHLVEHLRAGDLVTAHGPSGAFVAPPARGPRHLVLFAGGSGITPIASITRDVLRSEPSTRLTLVYGNRSEADVIFREELEALARQPRLRVVHVLSEPRTDAPCVRGVPDRGTVSRLVDDLALLERSEDEDPPLFFVCGPAPMMTEVRSALEARGVPRERILEERFLSPADPGSVRVAAGPQLVNVRLGGATHAVTVAPGKTVLEAALAQGVAMPFSCQMGGCGACKCKRVGGDLVMDEPNCLSEEEKAGAVVLACVARPLGPCAVEVG